ncbi:MULTISPECIES: undecaprenyl-phosphate galactose phosphotransferase WbaP [Paraburkholderia]|uniref:Undecaprenyl-phosphate galactose phosphotransferase WbaP n=1 Tax=Paraburkholderia madseniana TaxID=2599607 RepID=A0AAP5BHJ7_9BURK|nr:MULTISPECIES: undecaprenyl-phosphate galactose phosphotransferase WbaP [Paraburkholderia]MCX4149875.1 undecaprenyl-phosphate galactose phosphotransferase WbaP [Paraburkholderia madseniana]MDN7152811.1 undecaprenyl-phosphate galactose phosphotransferase WbaP [Paraburkholderia sp. WS6]MDQ6411693.1 undecaprenyl-phosphate galactose phosphotransferase WbaP [Paraburkholderia madseniana]
MNSTIRIEYASLPELGVTPFPALTNKVALAAADIVGFTVALLVTNRVLGSFVAESQKSVWSIFSHQPMLIYLALACIGTVWFWARLRHYSCRRPMWRELQEIFRMLIVLAVIHLALTALAKGTFSRGWWALTWSGALICVPVFRSVTKRALDWANLWKRPTLIVGCGESALEARRALSNQSFLGVDVIAYVAPDAQAAVDKEAIFVSDAPILQGITPATFRSLPGIQVVIALEHDHRALRDMWVRGLTKYGIRDVTVMASMRGVPLCGTDISYFFGHEVMMLRVQNNLARFSARVLKRIFDVVVGGFLLLMLLPIFAIIAALVAKDGSSAFFGHTRIGQNGKKFNCYKFRSMVPDAEKVLKELLERDPVARAEWERDFKLKDDVRITSIGALLRKTSLDELPQLWNVLRGDMSLVGPRPVIEKEIVRYGEESAYYFLAKPGMTGLWQVSGRNDTDYARRVFLDAWYVKNWSLWYDIMIMLKTVAVVIRRDGAY